MKLRVDDPQAAGMVGAAKYYLWSGEGGQELTPFRIAAIGAEVLLGFLTFTGSLMAAGKLQEIKWIPQRPVTYKLQNQSNLALLGLAVLCGFALIANPERFSLLFPLIIILALAFGLLIVFLVITGSIWIIANLHANLM